MATSEGPKTDTRRAETDGVLENGMFPFHQLWSLGKRCKRPIEVRGEATATWQFRKFYSLESRPSVDFPDYGRPME